MLQAESWHQNGLNDTLEQAKNSTQIICNYLSTTPPPSVLPFKLKERLQMCKALTQIVRCCLQQLTLVCTYKACIWWDLLFTHWAWGEAGSSVVPELLATGGCEVGLTRSLFEEVWLQKTSWAPRPVHSFLRQRNWSPEKSSFFQDCIIVSWWS